MRAHRYALVLLLAGCGPVVGAQHPGLTVSPARRGGVTFIGPRCAAVESCLLGQVVEAESSNPLVQAAVFLEREAHDNEDGKPVRILRLTDDQGIFTVADAPAGRYRIAVYADARQVAANGLVLGQPGTTMVPVRMPPAI
jgi:hypothetical protein